MSDLGRQPRNSRGRGKAGRKMALMEKRLFGVYSKAFPLVSFWSVPVVPPCDRETCLR